MNDPKKNFETIFFSTQNRKPLNDYCISIISFCSGDGEVKKRRGREEETEVVAAVTEQHSCLAQFQHDRSPTVLHFAIVACNDQDADALLTMKSIILLTNANVYFHIFTNEVRFFFAEGIRGFVFEISYL